MLSFSARTDLAVGDWGASAKYAAPLPTRSAGEKLRSNCCALVASGIAFRTPPDDS